MVLSENVRIDDLNTGHLGSSTGLDQKKICKDCICRRCIPKTYLGKTYLGKTYNLENN